MAAKDDIEPEEIEEEVEAERIEEAEDEYEDDNEDEAEDRFEQNQNFQQDYDAPMPDEKLNSHTIINKALERKDTIRTTFLTENELGRPLFSVRFLAELHEDAMRPITVGDEVTYLDKIADYYYQKIQNITESGMSNKGFMMNLNVTQKRDQVKRRVKDTPKDSTTNERRF